MSAIPWVGQDIVESNNITEMCTTTTNTVYLSMLPVIGKVHNNA